jgi:DNA topoisomerase-1
MIIRKGKFGEFYACSNYPTCKFTMAKTKPTGIMCPKCGKEILEREGKNGKEFYSCSDYPNCNFSTWDIPTEKKCPKCGDMLLKKKTRNMLVCGNQKCTYKEKTDI